MPFASQYSQFNCFNAYNCKKSRAPCLKRIKFARKEEKMVKRNQWLSLSKSLFGD